MMDCRGNRGGTACVAFPLDHTVWACCLLWHSITISEGTLVICSEVQCLQHQILLNNEKLMVFKAIIHWTRQSAMTPKFCPKSFILITTESTKTYCKLTPQFGNRVEKLLWNSCSVMNLYLFAFVSTEARATLCRLCVKCSSYDLENDVITFFPFGSFKW